MHQWHSRVFIATNITAGLTDRRPITSRLNWPIRSISRVYCHQLTWYSTLWLWRWLPHRLSKGQSLSATTVLFRTTLTRTIVFHLLITSVYLNNQTLLGPPLSKRFWTWILGSQIQRLFWFSVRSIVDDSEMYEQQKPFRLDELVQISAFLNTLVFKMLWNDMVDGRCCVYNFKRTVLKFWNFVFVFIETREQMLNAAHTLLMILYDRDCRRKFTTPDHWLIRLVINQQIVRM